MWETLYYWGEQQFQMLCGAMQDRDREGPLKKTSDFSMLAWFGALLIHSSFAPNI